MIEYARFFLPGYEVTRMRERLCWLYQIYIWVVFYPLCWALTVVFALASTLSAWLISASFASRRVAPLWGKLILWLTPARVRLHGLQHLDPQRSVVIIANHQSLFDILVIYGHLPVDFKWVMKIELRRMPFVGFACHQLGHVFIDRSNRKAAANSIEAAGRKLVGGVSVLFFPEGTRSPDGALLPFKKGAFRMAKELNLPLLPITIRGADAVMPARSLKICPGTIDLCIHAPIDADAVAALGVDALAARSREQIASALTEHPSVPRE